MQLLTAVSARFAHPQNPGANRSYTEDAAERNADSEHGLGARPYQQVGGKQSLRDEEQDRRDGEAPVMPKKPDDNNGEWPAQENDSTHCERVQHQGNEHDFGKSALDWGTDHPERFEEKLKKEGERHERYNKVAPGYYGFPLTSGVHGSAWS